MEGPLNMPKRKPHLLQPLVRRDDCARQSGPGMEQPLVRRATACPVCSDRGWMLVETPNGPESRTCNLCEDMRATNIVLDGDLKT